MPFAITQSCCADASCVEVCPVDCIHPTPEEPDFGKTDILYVDPRSCIDCGACADACPASAVKPIELLRGGEEVFADLNAAYYEERPEREVAKQQTHARVRPGVPSGLRVAVVGTGPAATYAARELLAASDCHVSFVDRQPMAGGLLRAGVAPDHGDTKRVIDTFAWTYEHPRVRMYMNVEVGRHVTHAELLEHHDAVVYGVGAPDDRALGVDGEDLPGVHGATETVAWYNGDPGVAPEAVRVGGSRAFVVGNGNVALDVARILLGDTDRLAGTEIADHALEALREADVREVVLLGRRGPEHAAFTRPELLTLPDGIELVVEDDEATAAALDAAIGDRYASNAALLAELPRVRSDWTDEPGPGRRLVMAFGRRVSRALGEGRLAGITITGPDGDLDVPTELLVCSTGPSRPCSAPASRSTRPSAPCRTTRAASSTRRPGWPCRVRTSSGGPSAGRGVVSAPTGRARARPSRPCWPTPPPVRCLRRLPGERAFGALVADRQPRVVRARGVRAIDAAEQEAGRAAGRPRVKITTAEELLATAGARRR